MPIDTIYVERIDLIPFGRKLIYSVTGQYADGRLGLFQCSTLNVLRASICQRALDLDRPVEIAWMDAPTDRWGSSPGRRVIDATLVSDVA